MAIYQTFYGLERDPFGGTPDPDFLFLTPGHKEALAQLIYAVQERKGFILLTAEVGMGKTTLLQALRRELDSNTTVAYISNSLLPFPGILEYMLEEFEIEKPGESQAQRLVALQNFLLERHRTGQSTVLILDEAQNLYPQTLEQIRLLSNFETTKEKILQIILVGQPELMARLELPELRQLKQRIGIVCTIPPMTAANTRSYIRTRLRLGGARDLGIFTEDALDRIAEYAAGIPRVVSTICDHCLLIGYADQTRRIDVDIVDQAIAYLNAGVRPRETRRRSVPSSSQSARIVARRRARRQMSPLGWGLLGTSAAVVAAGAMLAVFHPELFPQAMDASSNHLHDLARTVRSLLGR